MTSEQTGNCATGAQHRTLILTVTVPEEHYDQTLAALQILRTGLATTYVTGEPERACSWEGPFDVAEADRLLIDALADDAEGRFESDDREPHIIMERALLAGVRALVREATGAGTVAVGV